MTVPPATVSQAGTGVPRVAPAVVLSRVGRLRRGQHTNPGDQPHVLLVRAQPDWPAPTELAVGGPPVRVVPCVSALAVQEEVTRWARQPVENGWLVLLTDASEDLLGDTVLAQVYRQRVDVIEPWAAVLEDFGATRTDPQLRAPADRWIAQALLEARPAGGWPSRPGGLLRREDALAELAAVRLGLTDFGLGAADLDIATLLRWTALPGATEALRRLGDDERAGLTAYLGDRTGRAGRTLLALVAAGNGDQALALGLVCDCLWPRSDEGGAPSLAVDAPAVERARVRVERYFGNTRLDETAMRAFADAAREVVATVLAPVRPGTARLGLTIGTTSLTLHPDDELPALLDTAERLLDGRAAGAASDILRSGFHHRLGLVARTIRDFLTSAESGVDRALLTTAAHDVAAAVGVLRAHLLAGIDRAEVERAVMAARVVRWLASQPSGSLGGGQAGAPRESRVRQGQPMTLPAALDAHLDDSAWVDVALGHVASGELTPEVGAVYGDLFRVTARRRRALDGSFARLLADWTAGPSGPGGPLVVEDVLDRVVAPVVTARGGRRALLVVLDGLSAAVATQLAAELRRDRWEECDPLGAEPAEPAGEPASPARRRNAVAVLPTLTATSRTSLLCGRLVTGDKTTETAAFENHARWGKRPARLFHHADLDGSPGAPLDRDLMEALASETPLVAVVINTVDDALTKGRGRDDAGWRMADFGKLGAVLASARNVDRVVIVTSDHGHVIDHGAAGLAAADAVSARHRVPDSADGAAGDGEVALAGPRVLAPAGRIVALWDPALHYLGRKGGYHGGASPAEVTVPVLAFLPFRLSVTSSSRDLLPPGWRQVPDQRPHWWRLELPDLISGLGGDTVKVAGRSGGEVAGGPAETILLPRKRRRPAEEQAGPALFDLPRTGGAADVVASPAATADVSASPSSPAAATQEPVDLLIAGLLGSELFQSQLKGLARPLAVNKVEAAVRALLEANGTLATLVVAERAGEISRRAGGFAVNLRRLFNIDNYPVLDELDDGHTLRLNVDLLRQQFGLPA
ncbi:BREX-2 system phosphatase PglZ [Pseudofrankia asymbiotica]|uniref:Alkaline phosphatase n=1 Tax=Pseudofrankia asymbiotica TaxID=1834516 RepID=A0A1V2I393_9ACTN|nr:BREX-2 system phosphatase PglZ [Pseudofrankia asymbiotica]ONH24914.1 alkaline phosphatase [Pseudofrankia asymbiotica]